MCLFLYIATSCSVVNFGLQDGYLCKRSYDAMGWVVRRQAFSRLSSGSHGFGRIAKIYRMNPTTSLVVITGNDVLSVSAQPHHGFCIPVD
jgi:hypothetical protein